VKNNDELLRLLMSANQGLGGQIFEKAIVNIQVGLCPTCGEAYKGFRDRASIEEYRISRMCQDCQDSVFKEPDDDEMFYDPPEN